MTITKSNATVTTTSGSVISGFCNGKNYNGTYYVGGKKIAAAQIANVVCGPCAPLAYGRSSTVAKKTAVRSNADQGPCRKCGSYCYGDCEANS